MTATADEIKSAYKKLAMKYHPDRNQGSKFHEEHFKKIVEAYQTLSDKDKRNLYDLRNFYDAYKARNPEAAARAAAEPARAYGTANEYTRAYQRRAYKPPADPYATRPSSPPTAQQPAWYRRAHFLVAIFWGVACVGMLFYWMYASVQHSNAVEAFQAGNYEKALYYDEYYGEAYEALGDQQKQAGVYDRAAHNYKMAERYLSSFTWQLLAKRAYCYEQTEDEDLAINDLEDALRMAPVKDSISTRLAELFVFDIKKPEKAKPYLETVLGNPGLSQDLQYRALYTAGIGDLLDANYASSINYLNKASALSQVTAELYFYRGLAHSRNGDFVEGCEDWFRAKGMGLQLAAEYYDERHCAYIQQQATTAKSRAAN